MSYRSRVAALVTALALVPAFAACGSNGDSTAGDTSGSSSTSVAASGDSSSSSDDSPSSSGDAAAPSRGGTLTVVSAEPPGSLNPVKAHVGADNWYINLAYDTVLRVGPDGSIEPDLATAWGYVGDDNTVFEFTLRDGVTFADGTELTAKDAADSLNYARENGLHGPWVKSIDKVEAVDAKTVRISCSSPNPNIPMLLGQIQMVGSVMSSAGLADPDKMGTATFGAGPYVLDTAQTVSGDHYTYTANPHYWDESKIHWDTIVIKVVSNPQSALNTLKVGQASLMSITADQADSAKAAGLTVINAPVVLSGLLLADRDGTLSEPLKDPRVRQALNYAVDRASITSAVYGEYGQPTDQLSLPGLDGYVEGYDDHYSYDPEKAKQLLAEAGYPDGFSTTAEVTSIAQLDLVPQAVFQQWQQIGVNVDVTTDATIAAWGENSRSTNWPIYGFGYGGLPTYLLSLDWMLPNQTHFNPFGTGDQTLTDLLTEAAATPGDAQAAKYQEAMKYFVDQAWTVPVSRSDSLYAYDASTIGGVTITSGYTPDLAWAVAPAA